MATNDTDYLHGQYFHGNINKSEAESLLEADGGFDNPGKFLVRSKGGSTDNFILSVVYKGAATHHMLVRESEGSEFMLNKQSTGATTIGGVIDAYRSKRPKWPVPLTDGVPTANASSSKPKKASSKAVEPEPTTADDGDNADDGKNQNISERVRVWVRNIRRISGSNGSARDTLDELIDEREESELPLDPDERLLVANILELRNLTIYDVMVPRADIVAIPINASLKEVIDIATREGHSRLPIYSETLDDAQGMVHIKDVVG